MFQSQVIDGRYVVEHKKNIANFNVTFDVYLMAPEL